METSTTHGPVDAEPLDDDGLRAALQQLASCPDPNGMPQWEAIGRQLVALARRESLGWPRHAQEFQGAFVEEAVYRLRRYPDTVIAAEHPWRLLCTRARHAAKGAVAAESRVGITDRDPITHRVRIAELSKLKVSSYDVLVERGDDRVRRWTA